MLFSGFIFDVEGTLIDCIPQNLQSLQETLAEFGVFMEQEVRHGGTAVYAGVQA